MHQFPKQWSTSYTFWAHGQSTGSRKGHRQDSWSNMAKRTATSGWVCTGECVPWNVHSHGNVHSGANTPWGICSYAEACVKYTLQHLCLWTKPCFRAFVAVDKIMIQWCLKGPLMGLRPIEKAMTGKVYLKVPTAVDKSMLQQVYLWRGCGPLQSSHQKANLALAIDTSMTQ